MRHKILLFIVGVVALATAGCETTSTPPYQPFKTDQEKFFSTTKTIALAPIAVPANLEVSERQISQFESLIENKIRDAGFSVVLSNEYRDIWKRENELIGGCFDPATGKRDETKFRTVEKRTFEELEKEFNADAVLFTKILVVKARFSNFEAEWDGVEESFDVRHGVLKFLDTSTSSGSVGALSMKATIKDMDGTTLYINQGGIQVLSTYHSRGFVPIPTHDLLLNQGRNIGAVNVTLWPVIGNPSIIEASQSQ